MNNNHDNGIVISVIYAAAIPVESIAVNNVDDTIVIKVPQGISFLKDN